MPVEISTLAHRPSASNWRLAQGSGIKNLKKMINIDYIIIYKHLAFFFLNHER